MGTEIEILVMGADGESTAALRAGLQGLGFVVDHVTDLGAARARFLERGGHTVLVIAPDVAAGRAREAIADLRSVDGDLQVIVFGEEILRDDSSRHLHRVRSFHPGSRAGIGAVQQIVCSLV